MATAAVEDGLTRSRALWLIEQGRLAIIEASRDGRVVAHVRSGDGGLHRVVRSPSGRLGCGCLAARFGNPCSHLAALVLVCPPPTRNGAEA